MARRLGGGLRFVAAMESESEEERNVPAAAAEEGAGADTMEADLAEVNDAHAEAEEAEAQVDEAEETAEALESFAVALEGIQETGGLDKNGGMILSLAMEHFANRLGLEIAQPSMESYGSISKRSDSTRIALEDIKDQIASIWAAIIAQIKKSIDWLMGYYNKVFGAAEKLIKRAKALQSRADGTSGTAKNKKIKKDSLVESLQLDNQPPRAGSVTTGADALTKLANAIFVTAAAKAGSIGDEAVDAIDKGDAEAASKITLLIVAPAGSSVVGNAEAEGLQSGAEGVEVHRTERLFGDMAIITRTPKSGLSGIDAVKAIAKSSATVAKFNKAVKKPTNVEVDVLSPTDAGKVALSVEELGDELLQYRKSLDKIKTAKTKLVAACEKASKAGAEGEDKEKRANGKAFAALASSASNLMTQPAASFAKYSLNTGKALLDLVQYSLNEYSAA